MRDDMVVGDRILIYHSNADPPGIAGLARVCALAQPDRTAFDPASPYYDPASKADAPRWVCVQVEHVQTLARVVTLAEIRAEPLLEGMLLVQPGQRLSIQPVTAAEWAAIESLIGT